MNEIKKELKSTTFGYISAALGLVAGLAWNDAIKELIETAFPLSRNTIGVKFLYAILVTVVVIILIKSINKMINRQIDK
ncbi:MAG: DUF5654 family protein [Candidatus Zambryskibacteria bacterium]|nr:DUF5654 family protein [Candidatus Zambryskibacteria bacterium]